MEEGNRIPIYIHRSEIPKASLWMPLVEAWVPEYIEGVGNCTRILLRKDQGQFHLARTAATVLRTVTAHYFIDYHRLREAYIQRFGRSQAPPVVVAATDDVFVPVKVRKPRVKNDGSLGYVAVSAVERVVQCQPGSCVITTHGGHDIPVLTTQRHTEIQLQQASLFAHWLKQDGLIR